LTLNKRVSSLSRSIHFYTRALCHIRPALSESMAATLGASLVQSRLDYANSITYGMSASNMHKLYSLPRILLLVWFCLLFVIFQQVGDLVTYTTEYSSKSLHLPIRPCQPVSHLTSTISSNYTSHHELSVLQPSTYSKYDICLQILVGAPSATALLQHGNPFLPPPKIVRPYIVSSAT